MVSDNSSISTNNVSPVPALQCLATWCGANKTREDIDERNGTGQDEKGVREF